jgi:hypothetical protein
MSTVKADDIINPTGGIPTVAGKDLICNTWVNFNGTGTVSIRDSANVSSITDLGVARYEVNFAKAMVHTNYSISQAYTNEVSGQHTVGFVEIINGNYTFLEKFKISQYNITFEPNRADKSMVCCAVFGGQA